jgi:hypothetical protein
VIKKSQYKGGQGSAWAVVLWKKNTSKANTVSVTKL